MLRTPLFALLIAILVLGFGGFVADRVVDVDTSTGVVCLRGGPTSACLALGRVDAGSGRFTPTLPPETVTFRPLDLVADFHADPTGATPADAPWAAWLAALRDGHRRGFVPAGTYRFERQIVVDLAGWSPHAFHIDCEGYTSTVLDVRAVRISPQMLVTRSGGRPGALADQFYGHMHGCSVRGDTRNVAVGEARTVLAIGRPDLTDALNGNDFGLEVQNADGVHPSAVAVQLNGNYASTFYLTANGGGSRTVGTALQLTQTDFSTLQGSFGNAATAVHLTRGYVFGNTFLNLDMEEVRHDLVIDTPTGNYNVFTGGQWSYSVGGIVATAGKGNLILSPNDGPGHGAAPNFVVAGTGVTIVRGATVEPADGLTLQSGPTEQRRDIAAGGHLYRDGVDLDGTSRHVNATPGARDIRIVATGGGFEERVADTLVTSRTAKAVTTHVNEQVAGDPIAAVEAGDGAACAQPATCHDSAGRIRVGDRPGRTVTVTFDTLTPFDNAPVCFAQDETSDVALRATRVSRSSVTFTADGPLRSGDLVSYRCTGL